MFDIGKNIKLTLENIILMGVSTNNYSLVIVNDGGTLIMNNNAKITGNTRTVAAKIPGNGGGVVMWGGTFTMNGGEISGNTTYGWGGGVAVTGGIFTMKGGIISDNKALKSQNKNDDGTYAGQAGGVTVAENGTFNMIDGEIKGNTAEDTGGGVWVWLGKFNKTGGTIYGLDDAGNKNTAGGWEDSSAISGFIGKADANNAIYKKNTTGPNDNLSCGSASAAGKWNDGDSNETVKRILPGSTVSSMGLTSSAPFYQIVDLPSEGRYDVMKVRRADSENYWSPALYSLSAYKDKEITITLSVDVKRAGGAGRAMSWQLNNKNDEYPEVATKHDASEDWYTMTGELTAIPNGEYPSLFLSDWKPEGEPYGDTTYYIDNFTVSIKE
jgi:hypothetical protein